MMHKLAGLILLLISVTTTAQNTDKVWRPYDTTATVNLGNGTGDDVEQGGFNPNRIFVGGSIGLGLGFGSETSSWAVGGFPQIGYSLANWVDVGLAANLNYNVQKYYNDKYTSFNYGVGAFLRVFPFKSVFLQAQPEANWIYYKEKYALGGQQNVTVNAPSMLLGIGFGQRMVGHSGYFTTIMIDALNEKHSPYRNPNGNISPVIRAGFYVYLGKSKNKSSSDY